MAKVTTAKAGVRRSSRIKGQASRSRGPTAENQPTTTAKVTKAGAKTTDAGRSKSSKSPVKKDQPVKGKVKSTDVLKPESSGVKCLMKTSPSKSPSNKVTNKAPAHAGSRQTSDKTGTTTKQKTVSQSSTTAKKAGQMAEMVANKTGVKPTSSSPKKARVDSPAKRASMAAEEVLVKVTALGSKVFKTLG